MPTAGTYRPRSPRRPPDASATSIPNSASTKPLARAQPRLVASNSERRRTTIAPHHVTLSGRRPHLPPSKASTQRSFSIFRKAYTQQNPVPSSSRGPSGALGGWPPTQPGVRQRFLRAGVRALRRSWRATKRRRTQGEDWWWSERAGGVGAFGGAGVGWRRVRGFGGARSLGGARVRATCGGVRWWCCGECGGALSGVSGEAARLPGAPWGRFQRRQRWDDEGGVASWLRAIVIRLLPLGAARRVGALLLATDSARGRARTPSGALILAKPMRPAGEIAGHAADGRHTLSLTILCETVYS